MVSNFIKTGLKYLPVFPSELLLNLLFFSFEQARDMLTNEEVLAPVYYILGGTKSGEVSKLDSKFKIKQIFGFINRIDN